MLGWASKTGQNWNAWTLRYPSKVIGYLQRHWPLIPIPTCGHYELPGQLGGNNRHSKRHKWSGLAMTFASWAGRLDSMSTVVSRSDWPSAWVWEKWSQMPPIFWTRNEKPQLRKKILWGDVKDTTSDQMIRVSFSNMPVDWDPPLPKKQCQHNPNFNLQSSV